MWPFSSNTPLSFDCLPNAIVNTYGTIISASDAFYSYFHCCNGMSVRDLMRLRVVNNQIVCFTDFNKWIMIYEAIGDNNFKIWMAGVMPINPTVWHIPYCMAFCNTARLLAHNNAFKAEFTDLIDDLEELSLTSDDLSDGANIDVLIKGSRYIIEAHMAGIKNCWILIFRKYNNLDASLTVMKTCVHDVRNILTIIQAYCEIKTSLSIEKIRELIEKATLLMNNALRFVTAKDDNQNLTNIIDFMKIFLDEINAALNNIKIKVVFKLDMAYIALSSTELDQIVSNVIKNSKDAGATEISIRISKRNFEKNWAINGCRIKQGQHIELAISDNGEGISDANYQKLFKFSTKNDGIGIGLQSVRMILNKIGGAIVIVSNQNIGTRISLYMPLVEYVSTLPEKRIEPMLEVKAKGSKIVLVEDNNDIRSMFACILRDKGYSVSEFQNAEDLLSVIDTMEINVLVTDVNLPGANGGYLANEVRKTDPSALIIAVSGMNDQIIKDLFPKDVIFLCKPITGGELVKEIEKAIKGCKNSHKCNN